MCLCGNKANKGVLKVYLVLSTVYDRQLISVIVSYALAYSQECDVQMSKVCCGTLSREVHCGQMQFSWVACLVWRAVAHCVCWFLHRDF